MEAAKQTEQSGWDIDVGEGELSGVSGYRHYLVVNPEQRSVSLFYCYGAGTPESVWHRRCTTIDLPVGVYADSVVECLRAHTDELDEIADLYEGTEWNGSNHVGHWSDTERRDQIAETIEHALSELPRRHDEKEWLWGDIREALRSAGKALTEGLTIEQWAQAEADEHEHEAILEPDALATVLIDAVKSDPERLSDCYGSLVVGAELLARLAGVELPGESDA